MEQQLRKLRDDLVAINKRRFLCLATTANIHNPDLYIGGFRHTEAEVAANIILATAKHLDVILRLFAPVVEAILVDCEVKNKLADLPQRVRDFSPACPVIQYKPNDLTVDSLDMVIALLRDDWRGKRATVVGAGNIGAKIALRLAERGVRVSLVGRDPAKVQEIVAGLQHVVRGAGSLMAGVAGIADFAGTHLVLGCTPGTPAIPPEAIDILAPGAILVDVGNGTIGADALQRANARGFRVICHSTQAGFVGFMAHLAEAQRFLKRLGSRQLSNGARLISIGLIGERGDILVDDINKPSRVIGVCDGRGDTLSGELAQQYLAKVRLDDNG